MKKKNVRNLDLSVIGLLLFFFTFSCNGPVRAQEKSEQDAKSADQKPLIEEQSPSESKDPPDTQKAIGVVFVDKDENGSFSEGDIPQPGVRVSNGKTIVSTDRKGQYEIEIDDDSIIFVIKPRGRRTVVDDRKLPKFYYIHKPSGSPELKYKGVAPTGDLPASIDFALYEQEEPEKFSTILFGDPQGRNITELDYIARDVVSELIGNDASFGVTLGDIVFDDLDLFDAQNQTVAMVGIPWYNVIGNHDINFDAHNRKTANDSFERVYGPSYYSFDYGHVHFVVLDNINWIVPEDDVQGAPHYEGGFGEQQLKWLEQDLALLDENQMVVLLMHIPVVGCTDAENLYRLIENRPLCVSISGHTHFHAHRFLNEKDGWKGKQPHHHIINVTVSGSWWGGQKDERGIPHATMSDGAPNGYSVMTFDGDKYSLDYRASGRPKDYQMSISIPDEVKFEDLEKTYVYANVFNGSEKSKVEIRLDNSGKWIEMEKAKGPDPTFVQMVERELSILPVVNPPLPKPGDCEHLWKGKLPLDLKNGHHLVTVRWTDMNDRELQNSQIFRVVKKPDPEQPNDEQTAVDEAKKKQTSSK